MASAKDKLGGRVWSREEQHSEQCEAVPQESEFVARPTTMNHTGVLESKAREHDEASSQWRHWRKELGKSTKCVVVQVKSFLQHIFQRRLAEFW